MDWVAAVVTVLATVLVAANLGARVTGWGLAMLAGASVIWITTGMMAGLDQPSVVVMHSILLAVNAVGVYRWLGPERRHEDSREKVAEHTRWARVPTLFSAGSLIGASVQKGKDAAYGKIVDAMFQCDDKSLAYVVISEGGIGGAGETLRAVPPDHLQFENDTVRCDLSEEEWHSMPPIEDDRWPTKAPPPAKPTHAGTR